MTSLSIAAFNVKGRMRYPLEVPIQYVLPGVQKAVARYIARLIAIPVLFEQLLARSQLVSKNAYETLLA